MMVPVILISTLMILLSNLSVIRHPICGNNYSWLPKLESDLRDTVDWGRKWLDFNAGKIQLVAFDQSNDSGVIDVKMDGFVLEEKSSFKILGLSFSSKQDWVSYIVSIAKTASKKVAALIRSTKFPSPEVALYLCKSTILAWNTVVICGLVFLAATWICQISCLNGYAGLQGFHLLSLLFVKRVCKTAGLSLAVSLICQVFI